jgi:hypothetical protein
LFSRWSGKIPLAVYDRSEQAFFVSQDQKGWRLLIFQESISVQISF